MGPLVIEVVGEGVEVELELVDPVKAIVRGFLASAATAFVTTACDGESGFARHAAYPVNA